MAEGELRQAIEKFAKDLAAKAESFVADVSSLEVRTFTTPTAQIATLQGQEMDLKDDAVMGQMQLRAYTKIDFDCDTTICLPVDENDQIDRSVWDMHQAMVNQALKQREAMLKTMGEALSSAVDALKKLPG